MPTRTVEERAAISAGMRRWHAELRAIRDARERVLRVLGWVEALFRDRAAQGDALDRFVLTELDKAYDALSLETSWLASEQHATETAHVSPGPSLPVSTETGPRP